MRSLLISTLLVITLFSCNEEDFCTIPDFTVDQVQLAADIVELDQYLAINNINADIHPSGIRYVINDPGAGRQPDGCTSVKVSYTGKLLNGDIFDQTAQGQAIDFNLSGLISGWQICLPLIQKEGLITLYIPSGYAYGAAAVGDIPPNSPLIFDIFLKDVRSVN